MLASLPRWLRSIGAGHPGRLLLFGPIIDGGDPRGHVRGGHQMVCCGWTWKESETMCA